MMPFDALSAAAKSLVIIWALLVCFGGIADAILLWRQRRYLLCALGALCFASGYYIRYMFDANPARPSVFALRTLWEHWAVMPLVLVIASVICIALYKDVRRWRVTHITSMSIKESMDSLPVGVCYYLDGGRCVLVNHRMNDIAVSLLGQPLQNGASFYNEVKGKQLYALSDGTAVTFRHRIISYEDAPLHELIADDITELYEKSEELRRDNEKARRLAANMKTYGETIADTVRRQEILQAKSSIHDEMNRMILATKKSIESESSPEERRDILRMWRGQVLLLCKEASTGKNKHVISDLNALAGAIGIRLLWDGAPKTEFAQTLTLFMAAAREAMANAVKHGNAGQLTIRIEEDADSLRAAFINDGKAPTEPLHESGGLKTLRERIEKAGGQMQTDAAGGFALCVTIPKEE